jgi:hypothetical protein
VRLQRLAIILLILLSLLPAFYFNRWLKRVIDPKRSFGRFLAYLAVSLAFVFLYTFSIAMIIFRVFPPAKR